MGNMGPRNLDAVTKSKHTIPFDCQQFFPPNRRFVERQEIQEKKVFEKSKVSTCLRSEPDFGSARKKLFRIKLKLWFKRICENSLAFFPQCSACLAT